MFIKKILNFIFNKKEELILPNRWNNKKCYECGIELNNMNISEWEIFANINDRLYSVKICKECNKKMERIYKKQK